MIMIIFDKLILVALAITRRMINKKTYEEKQTLITALKKVVFRETPSLLLQILLLKQQTAFSMGFST